MLLLHPFHPFSIPSLIHCCPRVSVFTIHFLPRDPIQIPMPSFQKRHASNAQTNQIVSSPRLLPLSTFINRMQRPPPMPMVRTRRTARPSRSITPSTSTPTTPRRTIIVRSTIRHPNLRWQQGTFEFVSSARHHFWQLRASARRVDLFDCLRMLHSSCTAAHVRLEESSFAFVVGLLHFSRSGSSGWSWRWVVEPGNFGVGSAAGCGAMRCSWSEPWCSSTSTTLEEENDTEEDEDCGCDDACGDASDGAVGELIARGRWSGGGGCLCVGRGGS